MHTSFIPEGIKLEKSANSHENLYLKRKAISRYLFNFAFENSKEKGYVTEKAFDALIAGTVPVYLGDSKHLKSLLPHPKAAIFIYDYHNNYENLANYLKYLMINQTAYEEHRAWRHTYNYTQHRMNHPLLIDSWYCRVCAWAVKASKNITVSKRTKLCPSENTPVQPLHSSKAPKRWEGLALQNIDDKQIYAVKEGVLHAIPDFDTFHFLGFELEKIKQLRHDQLEHILIGEPLNKLQ